MTNSDHDASPDRSPPHHQLKPSRTTFSFANSRLHLSGNPLHKPGQNREDGHLMSIGEEQEQESPSSVPSQEEAPLRFRKRESASTTELFYDLWFVANLNVFATIHPIKDRDNLVSFVCYFILLWITWFVTTVYDARFGQDGVLERIAVAGHLGVMMGFAVAGVSFDQSNLIGPIFRTMALCLMTSRIILALQYSVVLFHTREYHRGRKPLIFAIALHVIPAIAYLVSAVVSSHSTNQHLTAIWFVAGAVELITLLIHAIFSNTLSFKDTHFNERLNLLTLIIIGEGIIILSKNISTIVTYTWVKDVEYRWSPALCGLIASAAALIYITFQLYFDWMHHHNTVSALKQATWSIIHLPLHVCLVLLAEGGGQFVLWWHAIESFVDSVAKLNTSAADAILTRNSSEVAKALNSTTQSIFKKYEYTKGSDLNQTFTDMMNLPDSFWTSNSTGNSETWADMSSTIVTTVFNAINDAFKLSVKKNTNSTSHTEMLDVQYDLLVSTSRRLELIFAYAFICGGLVLAFLMVMHIISKHKRWSNFNIFRTLVVLILGLGLGLVSLTVTNAQIMADFLISPWPLPTITIAYAVILVLTHIPHPPRIFTKRTKGDPEKASMLEAKKGKGHEAKLSRGATLRQRLSELQRTPTRNRSESG